VRSRLTRTIRLTALFTALSAALGLVNLWGFWGPWRGFVVIGLQFSTLCWTSYQQVDAMHPMGVAVRIGPLRRLGESMAALVLRALPAHTGAGRAFVQPAEDQASRYARNSERGRLRLGVSIHVLHELISQLAIEDTHSTSDVSHMLRQHYLPSSALTEQLADISVQGQPATSDATLFVSHAQSCTFVKLLAAVEAHVSMHKLDVSKTYLWLDICCIRQDSVGSDVQEIAPLIAEIGSLVVVLDPWHAPVSLTRCWCLFELLEASLAGAELNLAFAMDDQVALGRALAHNRPQVLAALTSFDARQAKATMPADLSMIFEAIKARLSKEPGDDGIETFNALVHTAVQSALASYSWGIGSRNGADSSPGRTARDPSRRSKSRMRTL